MKSKLTSKIMAGIILLGSTAYGGDCKIIANSSVDAASVSKDDVKAVFLIRR